MSRISLMLVAVAVAAGVVGCAQCDTCDDFPAPCTGPNCGGGAAMLAPTMTQGGPPTMGASTPTAPPADDTAGPGPVVPPETPSPMTPSPTTPPADPISPPPPMDPAPKPN